MFNFLKNIKNKIIKNGDFYKEGKNIVLYFKCDNCGEKFRTHLRRGYDFSRDYENGGYIINKEFIGSKCYKKINLSAKFDEGYKIESYDLVGAKPISREEWENE